MPLTRCYSADSFVNLGETFGHYTPNYTYRHFYMSPSYWLNHRAASAWPHSMWRERQWMDFYDTFPYDKYNAYGPYKPQHWRNQPSYFYHGPPRSSVWTPDYARLYDSRYEQLYNRYADPFYHPVYKYWSRYGSRRLDALSRERRGVYYWNNRHYAITAQ